VEVIVMRWLLAVAIVIFGFVGVGHGGAVAQDEDSSLAGHALVGSWLVEVTVDGQSPLRLPNLASFTADGVVVVAAPALLPESPETAATRDVFSAGHGAWTLTGADTADVRFVFLVVDERGNPASINVVDGQIQVDAEAGAYTGEFVLTIISATGESPPPTSGTWDASRIVAGAEPMAPAIDPMEGATPVAAATPA
jgi:hypothetical protein